MGFIQSVLLNMFGRPKGFLGKVGGLIMARTNARFGIWVSELLEIEPSDRVLEVGFGPGMAIRHLASVADHVSGIDLSQEMVDQARALNADGIRNQRVDLRHGSVESLPFNDASYDKALAINSLQVWPNPPAGLRELQRIVKPGGRIALGFTRHSGQSVAGLEETLSAAGFVDISLKQTAQGFCLLATKPSACL